LADAFQQALPASTVVVGAAAVNETLTSPYRQWRQLHFTIIDHLLQ
jgi:hypothetical protein